MTATLRSCPRLITDVIDHRWQLDRPDDGATAVLECGHRFEFTDVELTERVVPVAVGGRLHCQHCADAELAAERESIVADLPGAD